MRIILILLLSISINGFGLIPKSYAIDDGILAVVNDEIITVKDLRDYIQSAYMNLVAQGLDKKAIEEAMLDMEINGLNRLIEDKLILTRANQLELEVREKIVDDKVNEIKAKYASEEEFLDALVQGGSTITEIRNKIRDQLKIQFVIDHEVKSKIYVNPHEVTRYYQEHMDEYKKKERVMLDSIFIAFQKDKELAAERAKEAIAQINAGKDFQEVAKEYSDLPSIGLVERGQFMALIEDTVFELKQDEVTPPIEVDNGIYIFKLKEKINSETAGIEEVKESIYNLLFRQKFKTKFEKWIAGLQKNAYIEVKK